jgi:hypothetical protein
MNKLLLVTAAIVVAFSALSFAAETAKPVGQAAAIVLLGSGYRDYEMSNVEIRPVAGSRMKAIGTAHSTRAAAETALNADKTCANPLEVSKNERIRL